MALFEKNMIILWFSNILSGDAFVHSVMKKFCALKLQWVTDVSLL